jgi:hypothetical protein
LRFKFAGNLSTTLHQKQPRNLMAKENPKKVEKTKFTSHFTNQEFLPVLVLWLKKLC